MWIIIYEYEYQYASSFPFIPTLINNLLLL